MSSRKRGPQKEQSNIEGPESYPSQMRTSLHMPTRSNTAYKEPRASTRRQERLILTEPSLPQMMTRDQTPALVTRHDKPTPRKTVHWNDLGILPPVQQAKPTRLALDHRDVACTTSGCERRREGYGHASGKCTTQEVKDLRLIVVCLVEELQDAGLQLHGSQTLLSKSHNFRGERYRPK